MKHLDLFSGIGGFALAARWAGIETVGFVEIDPFCQKVLKKHWPKVKIVGDIYEVDEKTFQRPVDVITGGFPCQPFSVAGKRKGTDDDRYLWPAMLDVIKTYQPTWVIGENVAGIIGMALEQVLSDLGNAGYETQAFVIPACAVNAPHRRDRVWVVAHAEGNGTRGWGIHRNGENGKRQDIQAVQNNGNEIWGSSSTDNAEGLRNRLTPDSDRTGSGTPTSGIDGHRQKESQEQQHWDENWYEVAARFCRVDDGVSPELDFIGGLNEYWGNKKSQSEIRELEKQVLCEMWEHKELAKTSPLLYSQRLYNLMPEMSHLNSRGGWHLGKRHEEECSLCSLCSLCDLWAAVYAKRQPYTQDVRERLLEGFRKTQCTKTVANRVDRLKSLGNAIVPQVAYEILNTLLLAGERWA